MGFRFHRSLKIVPGLRLNLSKTGISASVGERGMTVNVRGDRLRETASLPGTGLSYQTSQRMRGGRWILAGVVALGLAAAWQLR